MHPNRIARKKRQQSVTKHHTTVLDSSDDGSLLVNGDDRGTQTRFQVRVVSVTTEVLSSASHSV
jgi:hypothetical protein